MEKYIFKVLLLLVIFLLSFSPIGVLAEEDNSHTIYSVQNQKPPMLDVIAVRLDPKEPEPQDIFEATFTVKNYGQCDAQNIMVQFDGMSNFELAEGLTNRKYYHRISTENQIHFKIKSIKGREGNEIGLSFSYDYRYDRDEGGGGSGSQQVTVTLPLPSVEADLPPNISVKEVTLEPALPHTNELFDVTFYLDNLTDNPAKNVNIEIDGQDNFEIVDVTNRKHLASISKETNNFVTFKLKNLEERSSSSVNLNFAYIYGEESTEKQQAITVNLPLSQTTQSRPQLKIKSYSIAQSANENEHLLKLILENLGEGQAKNIYLTLDGGSNIQITQSSNVSFLPAIEGGKEMGIDFMLGVNSVENVNYQPLDINIKYKDTIGNSYESSETLGINVADFFGAGSLGKPRVLINKYTLSDEKILAGNIVTLSLFIENTHARPVQNIKTSISVIKVEGSDGTGAGTGGTVFSPVDGSNSFFIEQIPARTTIEKKVALLVDPNATAKTYIVPVTIEYEDQKANSYSVEEMVNIPVTQECKLQILSTEVPPMAFIGQPAFIGAEFVNVGKVALNNFIVMLEGDFRKEQASYFVGNLQIGASDYYQGVVYPEEEGTLSGTLVFSYIDNNNREVQVEEPFQLEVQGARPMEPMPGDMPPEMMDPGANAGGSSLIKILLYIIIPLVILAAVAIFLRKRKKKKENEELLDA